MSQGRPHEDTDAELCERARAGDRAAWRTIIRRHTPMVYRLSARMLGSGGDAEDACQEAFMKAHRSFASFDPERALAPWLGRITYHTCLKRLAGRKQLALATDPEELAPSLEDEGRYPNPESELASRQAGRLVHAALDRLSVQDRALVTLTYMDGLTDAEVGEAVGMNRNTVRTRLHRARLVLQRALAPMLGGRRP